MDAYDYKIFQRRMNGIANLLMALAFITATVVSVLAILQQGWPWWVDMLSFCGIVLIWAFIFYGISKSPLRD